MMRLLDGFKQILNIQKLRRVVGYTCFYTFTAVLSYAYTSNTTRAGYSRGDQFYASYPAGTEILTDTAKLYKAALGTCFESEEWGPIEFSIMAKHFERQGKSPYAYHAGELVLVGASIVYFAITKWVSTHCMSNIWLTFFPMVNLMEVGSFLFYEGIWDGDKSGNLN